LSQRGNKAKSASVQVLNAPTASSPARFVPIFQAISAARAARTPQRQRFRNGNSNRAKNRHETARFREITHSQKWPFAAK
jgi:hypothetical protein